MTAYMLTMPEEKDAKYHSLADVPPIEPRPLNPDVLAKYQNMLKEMVKDAPLVSPFADDPRRSTWYHTPDENGRISAPPCQSGFFRVDSTIKVPRIAEILGIPEDRAYQAGVHAGLRQHGPGNAPNDSFMESDVVELRRKWDAGEACELVDVPTAATMLQMSAFKARNLLSSRGVHPVNPGQKPLKFARHKVVECMAPDTSTDDSVDVYEVATTLGIGIPAARQLVAAWPVVGKRSLGQGAPRRLYARSMLDQESARRRSKASKLAALRAKFEAELAALDLEDDD